MPNDNSTATSEIAAVTSGMASARISETGSQKKLHDAADKHLDGLLKNGRLPLGGRELAGGEAAKEARSEILKIAEKNFDKMQNGSWDEKKAIANQMNEYGQKVHYGTVNQYTGKNTHAPIDVSAVKQLGKVTAEFARDRAASLVPENASGTPETGTIPPKTQREVAVLMAGDTGFEALSRERAVDKTASAAQIIGGEIKAHASGSVRESSLMAGIERSQAKIQEKLAPYTSPGPEGAARMTAAVSEIMKNRDAMVNDPGLGNTELYAGVNAKNAASRDANSVSTNSVGAASSQSESAENRIAGTVRTAAERDSTAEPMVTGADGGRRTVAAPRNMDTGAGPDRQTPARQPDTQMDSSTASSNSPPPAQRQRTEPSVGTAVSGASSTTAATRGNGPASNTRSSSDKGQTRDDRADARSRDARGGR
jgi:hypothetical protein